VAGRAFNLGGGPDNAVSLMQVLAEIESLVRRPVKVDHADWRAGDQRYYVSDTRRAMDVLGLQRPRAWRDGVAGLCEWLRAQGRVSVEAAA